ncbi:hypothetical protein [Mycobacteroides abscessus]|uniref:hypothetical protein n=1 Tax=Mycobacteroides abscessus TaxID=36809 RepID=UPI0009A77930|nr:hypothetical protein [Mycobacteroides abscessus]RIT43482.1 hypothetical protein D2E80_21330 [Mycobacteroides abscessus]SKT91726.1 Uncharacterised protein [Mycobacteroides abscessus subsp. massiliense]SKU10522.1 Uncharacterised protein [Mycobacteroides abscessus subsp. massiliense]
MTDENGCLVLVDRGAVANGDDSVPHDETWLFPPSSTVTDLLIALATQFFPGMGMWLVYIELNAQRDHLLGMVNYDLGKARNPDGPLLTPAMGEDVTLTELSKMFDMAPLIVFGRYRSGLHSQLVTVNELQRARGYTGGTPTVIGAGAR